MGLSRVKTRAEHDSWRSHHFFICTPWDLHQPLLFGRFVHYATHIRTIDISPAGGMCCVVSGDVVVEALERYFNVGRLIVRVDLDLGERGPGV